MAAFNQALFNTTQFGPGQETAVTGIPFGSGPGSIAYQALRYAGQLRPGAIAAPEMLADALFECNAMIDSWNAQELTQQFIDDRYFAINTSQQNYTLGPTGDINTDINGNPLLYRPQRIVRANLILLNNTNEPTRIPIEIINIEDYADIPVLNIASQVTIRMWVQTTTGNVTIYMFPYPTTGNQLEFFMWPGYGQFASLSAIFVGNPAYQDAITYGLAERMWILRDKEVGDPRMAAQRGAYLKSKAIETKRIMEASNAPTPDLTPDLITRMGNDGQGAPFDYLSGDYSM